MEDGPGAEPPIDRFGRDAHRHPMHWDGSELGGFTTATPWLSPGEPREPQRRRPALRPRLDALALPAADRPSARAARAVSAARVRPATRSSSTAGRTPSPSTSASARSITGSPVSRCSRPARPSRVRACARSRGSCSAAATGRPARRGRRVCADAERLIALRPWRRDPPRGESWDQVALDGWSCSDALRRWRWQSAAATMRATAAAARRRSPGSSSTSRAAPARRSAKRCAKQSERRLHIQFEFLPADADGQREQLVRRLGAEDASIDIIGMDVIWTGEFANAGWVDRAAAGDVAEVVDRRRLPERGRDGEVRGQALGGAALVEHPAALVSQRPRRSPPEDLGRDDRRRPRSSPEDKNMIEVQGNSYEGLVVWFNPMVESAGTSRSLGGPEELALPQPETERALAVMVKLADSPVADPGDRHLRRGPRPARLRDRATPPS